MFLLNLDYRRSVLLNVAGTGRCALAPWPPILRSLGEVRDCLVAGRGMGAEEEGRRPSGKCGLEPGGGLSVALTPVATLSHTREGIYSMSPCQPGQGAQTQKAAVAKGVRIIAQ